VRHGEHYAGKIGEARRDLDRLSAPVYDWMG